MDADEARMANENGNSLRIAINEQLKAKRSCRIQNPRIRWPDKIIDEVCGEVRAAKWVVWRERTLFNETLVIKG